MANVIGVDPGKAGGIAYVFNTGVPAQCWKMPDTEMDLLDLLNELAGKPSRPRVAFLEHVQPGGLNRGKRETGQTMGSKSAYTFGYGNGVLKMGLLACGFRIEMVRPQQWQKSLGCLSRGDKNITKRKAQELFPGVAITHATADALLIAEYGVRKIAGRL